MRNIMLLYHCPCGLPWVRQPFSSVRFVSHRTLGVFRQNRWQAVAGRSGTGRGDRPRRGPYSGSACPRKPGTNVWTVGSLTTTTGKTNTPSLGYMR